MEPCPMCNGTYVTHQSQGLKTCHGCLDRICLECCHGARYTCALLRAELPPPPPLERQLTGNKWEDAEQDLRRSPWLAEITVAKLRGHIYKVVRRGKEILRIHSTTLCVECGEADIRYEEYEDHYKVHGFMCGKCLSKS